MRQARRPVEPPAEHDEDRDLTHQWQWSACYAPLSSMYLDQFGLARACCQNTEHPLGDIRTSTLREIWDGAATVELRTALGRADLGLGCDFCAWEAAEAGPVGSFSRIYDGTPVGPGRRPRWPRQLEFAVSNTCNLRCVMCNGDWSSAIRSRREHRPPIPEVYPERFYDELLEFIPHLRNARFTGGEPFLGTEPMRILDLLAEHGAQGLVTAIVTNATTWNDRIERILGRLTPWIVVSIDGGTREVYERIRVGASFDRVLANVDRLAGAVAATGVGMNLTHCLMVDNWETFPELLQLAEERGLDVAINTVRFPERHSLFQLAPQHLDHIVTSLESRTASVERSVTGPRLAVWHRQLGALRARASSDAWPTALGEPPVPARGTVTSVALGPVRGRVEP